MFYLKYASIGLLSGLSSGLVLGIGGRLGMRLVALVAGRAVEFSIEGSLGIMIIGCMLGLLGGVLFVILRRLIPTPGRWHGPLFGVLFYLILIPLMPPAIQEEVVQVADRMPLIVGIFGLLFICYGVVLQALVGRLSSTWGFPITHVGSAR